MKKILKNYNLLELFNSRHMPWIYLDNFNAKIEWIEIETGFNSDNEYFNFSLYMKKLNSKILKKVIINGGSIYSRYRICKSYKGMKYINTWLYDTKNESIEIFKYWGTK
jgi:hypothetical protein